MSQQESTPGLTGDALSSAESHLGHALALIHRILPRLDEAAKATEVQAALRRAVTLLESARSAHADSPAGRSIVAPDIAAAIAAAVAVLFDRPHRVVSVQPVAVATPHFNVWAFEGRTQIFQSHKVR